MKTDEQILREIFAETIAPLANRIDDLHRELVVLHRAIASSYEPLISPDEARKILGCGRDALNTMCTQKELEETIHWKWKNAEAQQKRRLFFRDVVLDYSIRGQSDPVGHNRFCIQFHNRKKVA